MADLLAPHGSIEALAAPPRFGDGLLVTSYPEDRVRLRALLAQRLIELGITAEPEPLETIHERLRPEQMLAGQSLLDGPTIQGEPRLRAAYRSVVAFLAREILAEDVVFEANPPLRFHFPMPMSDRLRGADGLVLTHHSDVMGGDPIDQINGWLPLTDCDATATLQYVPFATSQAALRRFALVLGNDPERLARSRYRFFDEMNADESVRQPIISASRPLVMRRGQVALFDARLIHGTAENVEPTTRISIDFRLLPTGIYDQMAPRWAANTTQRSSRWAKPLRGEFYDESSAYDL